MSVPLLGRRIDGIWHTSIIVYNREWQYSGGIVSGVPQPTLMGMSPARTHDLGQTDIPLELFQEFVRDMRPRFTQQTYGAASPVHCEPTDIAMVCRYNLLTHNCNNFTNEAAEFLLGQGIPSYITGLPAEVPPLPSNRNQFLRALA